MRTQRKKMEPELFGPQYVASLDTPIGKLWVESDGELIAHLLYQSRARP